MNRSALKFNQEWWNRAKPVQIVKAADWTGRERFRVMFDLSGPCPGVSTWGLERFADALAYCHERGLQFEVLGEIDLDGSVRVIDRAKRNAHLITVGAKAVSA